MILKLKYANPINNQINELNIKYPEIDYFKFKRLEDYNNDIDLFNILNELLNKLNCTKETPWGRLCMTTFPIYEEFLSEYYFYLIKIRNQFYYNFYIDRLIDVHVKNIKYEYDNPININRNTNKKHKKKKKTPPNVFVKRVSTDMFTGEQIYFYTNLRTNEEIKSSNPDLLDELNSSKKKERKPKVKTIGVPLDAMTFNFKIK